MIIREVKSPEKIINDILSGFFDSKQVIVIAEREKAITNTITQANDNDLILIVGKGHEDYQIIGNRQIYYSDRMTVARLLKVIK